MMLSKQLLSSDYGKDTKGLRLPMALLPVYDQNGANVTEVIMEDGTRTIINRRVLTVMNELKGQSRFNVDLLVKESKPYYGRKQAIPIPVNYNSIYIPCKTRRPVGANDGAFGYISMKHILAIDEYRIQLIGGYSVDLVSSSKGFQQLITIAELLESRYFPKEMVYV